MDTKNFLKDITKVILCCDSDGFYKFGGIPEKKLDNAKKTCAFDVTDTVLALVDSTVFGSAKEAMIVGINGIYWNNDWTTESARKFLSWEEIANSKFQIKSLIFDIEILPGCIFGMSKADMKKDTLIELLNKITYLYKNSVANEGQNNIPVAKDEIKSDFQEELTSKEFALEKNSFFFRFKNDFINILKTNKSLGKDLRLYTELYESWLIISSNFTVSKYFSQEMLRFVYDDDVIFQNFIFSSFNVSQMLSEHLEKEHIDNLLMPYGLVLASYAKFKEPETKRTLSNAINPFNDLKNSNESSEFKLHRSKYFLAFDNHGEGQACKWLSVYAKMKLNQKYADEYLECDLKSCRNNKNIEEYFDEISLITREKTEQILLQYFS